jgi:hypothetical protein
MAFTGLKHFIGKIAMVSLPVMMAILVVGVFILYLNVIGKILALTVTLKPAPMIRLLLLVAHQDCNQ